MYQPELGPVTSPVRRRTCRTPIARALVLVVAAAMASACGLFASGGHRTAAQCRPWTLHVAAAPSIAAPAAAVAARYNAAGRRAGGSCVTVEVDQRDPGLVVSALSGQGAVSGSIPVDAWIPDSTGWIDLARQTTPQGAARISSAAVSVAESPVVFAVPARAAGALRRAGLVPSWRSLVPSNTSFVADNASAASALPAPIQIKIPDAAADAAGLSALLALRSVVGHGPAALVKFVAAIHVAEYLRTANTATAYAAMQRPSQVPTVIVASEQSVFQHDAADPAAPVVPAYPAGGSVVLDYPYVDTTADPAHRAAVAGFGAALGTPAARALIQADGLRAPDGAAGPALSPRLGFDPRVPAQIPLPGPAVVYEIQQMWRRALLGARMLVVFDVSPSMGDWIPGTAHNRLGVTAAIMEQSLALVDNNDHLGMWVFDTGLNDPNDYEQIAPVRRMSDKLPSGITQRQFLMAAAAQSRPQVDVVTALYKTVLDAFRQMTQTYEPDRWNAIILLTDGTDQDPRPHALSLPNLLQELHAAYDPQRPVNVVTIGYGTYADYHALQKISAATGGESFLAAYPSQIQQFFAKVIVQFLCSSNCPPT
jgi:Ca-activated chloride channel family protein